MAMACERLSAVVAGLEGLWRALDWTCGGRRGGEAHKNSRRDGCAKAVWRTDAALSFTADHRDASYMVHKSRSTQHRADDDDDGAF